MQECLRSVIRLRKLSRRRMNRNRFTFAMLGQAVVVVTSSLLA
jgi:hypothetical protein